MRPKKDLTGLRFGSLVAISPTEERIRGNVVWLLNCDCGRTAKIHTNALVQGNSKSCGCKRDEALLKRETHGKSRSTIYKIWTGIMQRCYNEKYKDYHRYGARGISVHPDWQTFENFYNDVGDRPDPSLSLDRIDNDGHYEPGNMRWADKLTQNNNRRSHKGLNPYDRIPFEMKEHKYAKTPNR